KLSPADRISPHADRISPHAGRISTCPISFHMVDDCALFRRRDRVYSAPAAQRVRVRRSRRPCPAVSRAESGAGTGEHMSMAAMTSIAISGDTPLRDELARVAAAAGVELELADALPT